MEKIALVGPFSPEMRSALENELPGGLFELLEIDSYDKYWLLENADYIVIRTFTLTEKDIGCMPGVKLIQRWGTGYDTVDIRAAGKRGIPVSVTAGMNATPVAEMTVALALALYRNIVPLTNGIMNGCWQREEYCRRSYTLSGKTVGVWGLGYIGRKVAALFEAFGADIVYHDVYRLAPEIESELGVLYVSMDELWSQSDLLTLSAPLTEDTRHIVNAETIAKMKSGAAIVNTARAELIDFDAAATALKNGKLMGLAFDAVNEDILSNNPFSGMTNVILTPHVGGNTVDNVARMARRCAEQIMHVRGGGRLEPPHLVNGMYLVD